jgi:hypothetical protein
MGVCVVESDAIEAGYSVLAFDSRVHLSREVNVMRRVRKKGEDKGEDKSEEKGEEKFSR